MSIAAFRRETCLDNTQASFGIDSVFLAFLPWLVPCTSHFILAPVQLCVSPDIASANHMAAIACRHMDAGEVTC